MLPAISLTTSTWSQSANRPGLRSMSRLSNATRKVPGSNPGGGTPRLQGLAVDKHTEISTLKGWCGRPTPTALPTGAGCSLGGAPTALPPYRPTDRCWVGPRGAPTALPYLFTQNA